MKRPLLRLLIMVYRGTPEWLVRIIVFTIIGGSLVMGFVFLSLRPVSRQARQLLRRR